MKQPIRSIAAQSILLVLVLVLVLVLAPARRAKLGVDIVAGWPAECDKFIRAQYIEWSGVAKQAGSRASKASERRALAYGRWCAVASASVRCQISAAIGERLSSRIWLTSPTARAMTPRPRTTRASMPSSQAMAPIADVAFIGSTLGVRDCASACTACISFT